MFGLAYQPMQVITSDKVVLKGWFIPAVQKNQAQTILILHDVGKSKIMYLPMAKALQDRGFNVCLFDLRAHGESGGLLFSLGLHEDMDVKCIIDSVYKRINNKTIALMGIGLGADIALRLQHDPHVQCLILQSVGDRLSDYLKRNAKKRWGAFASVFYPVMKRNTERLLHVDIDTLSNASLANTIAKPIFFIGGLDDRIVPIVETRIVYDTCKVEEKQYWPIKDAGHDEVEQKGGEEYYNEISVFIVRSSPKKLGKSRFRRLAVLNLPN
jgi:alpha-beta hydrolase superfamily lysophospholipase